MTEASASVKKDGTLLGYNREGRDEVHFNVGVDEGLHLNLTSWQVERYRGRQFYAIQTMLCGYSNGERKYESSIHWGVDVRRVCRRIKEEHTLREGLLFSFIFIICIILSLLLKGLYVVSKLYVTLLILLMILLRVVVVVLSSALDLCPPGSHRLNLLS